MHAYGAGARVRDREAMADSDEEHERSKSRDKFRRERNDYGEKPRNRGDYRERRAWREDHEVNLDGISTTINRVHCMFSLFSFLCIEIDLVLVHVR